MKPRGFIRSMLPFWLFVLLFKFGASLHYTLLSSLGARILPVWVVGLIIGLAALVQLLCDVPAGYLLDRLGYTRLLFLCTVTFVIGALVLMAGLTTLTFILTVLLSTVGWLFFDPGTNAYMLARAEKHVAGRYLGFFHATLSAGTVLSAAILGIVLGWSAFSIGLIVACLLVFAVIAIRATPPVSAKAVHGERKTARHTYYIRRNFFWRVFAKVKDLNPASTLLLLQSFCGSLFYASIWFTIPIVLAAGLAHGLWSISLGVFDLAIVVLGSFLGKLADRADHKRLVFYGLLLFAVAGTIIGFNLNFWFLLLGFLATTGDEMSAVALWTWLDHLDKDHDEDGLLNGALVLFYDLGWTVGPIAAGFLYTIIGPTWTIVGAAIPIFLVWGLAVILFGTVSRAKLASMRLRHRVPIRLRHRN
jgi:MFS family permease